jgi:RND superfamily putative drug exporter
MARALYSLGRTAVRHRRLVVLIWLLVAIGLTLLARVAGGTLSDDFRVPGAESQAAIDLLFERFPEQAGGRAQIVLHVEDGSFADRARARAIDDAMSAVGRLDHVTATPSVVTGDLVRPDDPVAARTALAEVRFDLDVTELGGPAHEALHAALRPLADVGVQAEVGGELAQYMAKPAGGTEEVIGIAAAVLILLLTFGSVTAMGLPIGIALFGLATGTALVTLMAALLPVSPSSPMLGSMIGLGVGIDYALFIVTRHREHLADGLTVEDAAGRANATSGLAVIFAGGTVVIAICGLALVGLPLITTMGYAAAIVVAIMVVASVTLLPALFGFAGTRLAVATLPWVRRREAAHAARVERLTRLGGDPPQSRWERWAHHVSAHPWRYLLSGTAVMLVLAVPLLSMRLGQTDAGNADSGSSLRRAYDQLAEGFGPGFNGPLLVVVDLGSRAEMPPPSNGCRTPPPASPGWLSSLHRRSTRPGTRRCWPSSPTPPRSQRTRPPWSTASATTCCPRPSTAPGPPATSPVSRPCSSTSPTRSPTGCPGSSARSWGCRSCSSWPCSGPSSCPSRRPC